MFPASGASGWLRPIMQANPMTYGVTALRLAIFPTVPVAGEPGLVGSLAVVLIFGVVILAADTWLVRRR